MRYNRIAGGKRVAYGPNDGEKARRLQAKLEHAHLLYVTASRHFDSLVKTMPTECAKDEGSNRQIRGAGKASRAALEKYQRAIEIYTAFARSSFPLDR